MALHHCPLPLPPPPPRSPPAADLDPPHRPRPDRGPRPRHPSRGRRRHRRAPGRLLPSRDRLPLGQPSPHRLAAPSPQFAFSSRRRRPRRRRPGPVPPLPRRPVHDHPLLRRPGEQGGRVAGRRIACVQGRPPNCARLGARSSPHWPARCPQSPAFQPMRSFHSRAAPDHPPLRHRPAPTRRPHQNLALRCQSPGRPRRLFSRSAPAHRRPCCVGTGAPAWQRQLQPQSRRRQQSSSLGRPAACASSRWQATIRMHNTVQCKH